MLTPGSSRRTMKSAMSGAPPSGESRRARTGMYQSSGARVTNVLRPSSTQPPSTGVAVVSGMPPPAGLPSPSSVAAVLTSLPSSTAPRQSSSNQGSGYICASRSAPKRMRCMLRERAVEPSPAASASCTRTNRERGSSKPPCERGTVSFMKPASRSSAKFSWGKEPSRSWRGARSAKRSAREAARATQSGSDMGRSLAARRAEASDPLLYSRFAA